MAGTPGPARYNALGFEQITDLAASTALSIPDAVTGQMVAVLVTAEGADVRWRADGDDPTAAVGHILSDGETMWFEGNLNHLRFIEEAAGAKLNVSYLDDTRGWA